MLFVFFLAPLAAQTTSAEPEAPAGLKPILTYISSAWGTLTRSMTDCESVVDPKVTGKSVLYLPADVPEPDSVKEMASHCNVDVERLPITIHRLGELDTSKFHPHGLLYLPNKYVVPGGRFNEMYGWDSYFIIRGLLLSGKVDLARGIVDNFFYEIEHYGAVLNANRSYYLTRSQPPFLSSAVVEVYEVSRHHGGVDKAWLQRAYDDLDKDYEMWTHAPHLAGNTGLSRYFDFGEGPPAEAIKDETGVYRQVASYFFFHPAEADSYIVPISSAGKDAVAGAAYTLQVCQAQLTMAPAECSPPQQFKLSADYYKGDRSMRESGFDVSFRFGPFGAATHHYAPVCLNSLLYKNEKDLEQISRWLGRDADAKMWARRAEERKRLIAKYLWDPQRQTFFDYNFETGQRSRYVYATMFYPLWVGLATHEQAQGVVKSLKGFEQPGGLPMSIDDTGAQWDFPYGWGNIEMLTVDGLRRYGFDSDADRIAYDFLSTVAENFRRDGEIREKYNVATKSSEAHAEIGYHMNVVGFGWTNAAFLDLLRGLPKESVRRLANQQQEALSPQKQTVSTQ